jgi:FkbM family methyltransferase
MINIIEIGANDGGHTFEFSKNSKVWAFEPDPSNIKILKDKFISNKNVVIIEKAVSDFNGTSSFNIATNGMSSSLNELTDYSINNTNVRFENQINVNVIRMDTFINENGINEIDYFHCDAQGNDLKILNSFGNKLSLIKRGKVEVSFSEELYENVTNDLHSMVDFLKNNGFEISNWGDINDKLNKRYHDGNVEFFNKNYINLI